MNSQKSPNLSRLSVTGMFIAMTLLLASTSVAFGQERSKDRDNPTSLTSNELSDDLDGSNDDTSTSLAPGPEN
jgi:hypothetical protein